MKTIFVGSTNPVKIEAVQKGFTAVFPGELFAIEGMSVSSGVSDQPRSNTETQTGAIQRMNNVRRAHPEADYWVGLEGGIEDIDGDMQAFAWIVVGGKDGLIGKGKTGTFFLPGQIASLVREGKELGEADDIVFGRQNSKQSEGAVGLLTNGLINRATYYSLAVILALIPHKNTQLYAEST
jgi:inosine/xanthosine triphosphatase